MPNELISRASKPIFIEALTPGVVDDAADLKEPTLADRLPNRAGQRPRVAEPEMASDHPETDVFEHCLDGRGVWTPPVGWVAGGLSPGVKGHGRLPVPIQVNSSLENKQILCDAEDLLQRQQWMPQVVQHAKKEHDIEPSSRLW